MVSKEGGKCMLTNSESDSETTAAPSPSPCSASLALEAKCSLDASRQVRKRNKALQVRFKDICEAQNEQREAALRGGKPVAYKVAYRKYMTVPARRSIPNVTRSTGVQTSPDPKKRYQTFPFERKKGHTFKHAASVESYKGQNNGFVVDAKPPSSNKAAVARLGLDEEGEGEDLGAGGGGGACGGGGGSVRRTRALLHANECVGTAEQHSAPGGLCGAAGGALQLSCSADGTTDCRPRDAAVAVGMEADYRLCSVPPKPRTGLQQQQQQQQQRREGSGERSAKRQLAANPGEEGGSSFSTRTLPDRASRQAVAGPIAWNSLTQVECLDSPSVRSKRKKGQQLLQLNGLQSSSSQTLPRAAGCTTQAQCHAGQLSARPLRAMEEPLRAAPSSSCGGGGRGEARRGPVVVGAATAADHPGLTGEACKQIVPVSQEGGDVKAQLQAMENLISSSQETIKVLLGVIQELEKGEAHREGLSYRTGQDTANCDTCRNSACIIYSVELDFKQQEDKLHPLMKRLCPTDDAYFSPLPYPSSGEAFTSTPKRKSKAESKKHARWKLWFL